MIAILEPGIQTTVQDYPGRRGLLAKGFFPAGPMDHLAFRAANLLVGNAPDAAGLEVTLGNVALRVDGVVAVSGAEAEVTLDGRGVAMWAAHEGRELRIGAARGPGFRLYVAVAGGIDVPPVLGSRATYTMGALGGHEGRALQAGDRLPVGAERGEPRSISALPEYARDWEIRAMRGPQSAPDFLTERDLEMLFTRKWSVNPNSNRTGIRLEGGAFDLPVILCVDGPTAGGFVVAATVVHADLWKIGQLRPVGDTVRFREVSLDEALALDRELDARLA